MNPVVTALRTISVHITDDSGHVNEEHVHVSKSARQEVQWVADKHAAIVAFSSVQGTPFQDYVFHVPAGGSVSTGDINGVAYGHYKYTVAGPNGGIDPEVIIDP